MWRSLVAVAQAHFSGTIVETTSVVQKDTKLTSGQFKFIMSDFLTNYIILDSGSTWLNKVQTIGHSYRIYIEICQFELDSIRSKTRSQTVSLAFSFISFYLCLRFSRHSSIGFVLSFKHTYTCTHTFSCLFEKIELHLIRIQAKIKALINWFMIFCNLLLVASIVNIWSK